MTSIERREGRYQRRKAKREAKKAEATSATFDEVMSFGNLCKAALDCCKNVRWKTSTNNFEMDRIAQCELIYRSLQNGSWHFAGFKGFAIYERGKLRHIDAMHIRDRTVQKCLCQNYVLPIFSRTFIMDNGACMQGKGIASAMKRMVKHLRDHYKKYGTEGGIYQFDFKNYFESIPHDKIKEIARTTMPDDRLYNLFCQLVDDFDERKSTDIVKGKGVGLGSEISQSIALMYANSIDHYIKDQLSIKGYARFSDDGYVISDSLDELKEIQKAVHRLAKELGLEINEKKDKITPFKHHGFTFLKTRFRLYDNGKISRKINRRSTKTIRRRLKIFRKWADEKGFSIEDIIASYQSWRAYAKQSNSYRTLVAMDEYFVSLFGAELAKMQKPFKCTLKPVYVNGEWHYMSKKTV